FHRQSDDHEFDSVSMLRDELIGTSAEVAKRAIFRAERDKSHPQLIAYDDHLRLTLTRMAQRVFKLAQDCALAFVLAERNPQRETIEQHRTRGIFHNDAG